METDAEKRARRANMPTAKIRLHDDPDAIDRAYWHSLGDDEKITLCFDMTEANLRMLGYHEDQFRLRRSAERVLRR